jgi:hypothetical protein
MKPIWYFVGLVLMSMGVLVLGAGIYDALTGGGTTTLAQLHPGLWWGFLMVAFGALFFFTHRKSVVK